VDVRRNGGAALAVLCLGSILGACVAPKQPAPPQPPPPQLRPPPPDQAPPADSPSLSRSNLVTGLNNPWDMAFLSNGTMFFTERPGPVKVRLPNGVISNIVTPGDVAPAGEAGMMGLAVDPGFASNRLIYTCYTATGDNRVVRWQVNNTLNGVVGGGTVLVQGLAKANFHDGCRIRFGPDGKLWVTTGDGGVGTAPQNLDSINGKVLRINSDGSAPSDNPFVGQPGDDRVYTFGHRNPQGISFRPGDNAPYAIEHGPASNDEVNELVPGGNGGWDPVPGYDQSVPMTDLQKFPNAMIPAWRSGDSGTVAPSGGTFLTGSQWKSWDGALVVAFLKDSRARVMFLDGNGNVSFATRILEDGIRLRSAVQGPDGNLYISTDVGGGNGAIWRVVPS
jgi:glucose/arabinose dehydrogenase